MDRLLTFLLPIDWWRIPLVNEETRTANIDRMVDHQLLDVDGSAQLRHDLKEELYKQAAQAAEAGGIVMAFYLLNLDGIPVSATMAVYDVTGLMALPKEFNPAKILAHYVGDQELVESLPDWAEMLFPDGVPGESRKTIVDINGNETAAPAPIPPSIPASIEELLKQNPPIDEIPKSADDGGEKPEIPWVKITEYEVLAYRREIIREGTDYFGVEASKMKHLQVTYLQIVPDFGLVQTVFSTPMIQPRLTWIKMWDAIVATYRNGSPEEATIHIPEEE